LARRFSIAILAFAALALASCARQVADIDADRMGRTTIDAIQRADWPAIDKALAPQTMADPAHADRIEAVRKDFPADPPWSIKLITSDRTPPVEKAGVVTAPERSNLSYLYAFAQKRLIIDLEVEQHGWRRVYEPRPLKPGQAAAPLPEPPVEAQEPPKPQPDQRPYKVAKVFKLVAIRVTPLTSEQVKANTFAGASKSLGQWAFLAATFAVPFTMLGVAVAALRARGLKHRFLWALLAFLGSGWIWMDWTTGATNAVWLVPNPLGFGLERGPSPLSPWMLRFTLPVGAAIVALRLALLPRRPRT